MRFLSVCSGIEAASVAWRPLGWEAVAFSEIEPFPCAVLSHHYPDVPNWGDMTKFQEWPDVPIDLLCGGTPCQSFSVAGLRKGLADPRGNLMLTFGAIAAKYRPRWLVWENVAGVLNSSGGQDFASLLGLLSGQQIEVPAGGWSNSGIISGIPDAYGLSYRVLDAQYVRVESHPRAVPQRRRRVFVVGYLGDWRRAAAVLLERQSLSGHPAPRRKAGQRPAPTLSARTQGGGGLGTDFDLDGGLVRHTAVSSGHGWWDESDVGATIRVQDSATKADTLVAHTLLGKEHSSHAADKETYIAVQAFGGNDTRGPIEVATARNACASASGSGQMDFESETLLVAHSLRGEGFDASEDGTGRGTPLVPIAVDLRNGTLDDAAMSVQAGGMGEDRGLCINAIPHAMAYVPEVAATMAVRRLTPLETERLMGMPDGYTAIPVKGKPAADGPRYKSHGNSWAVNCPAWIGERINQVEALATRSPR